MMQVPGPRALAVLASPAGIAFFITLLLCGIAAGNSVSPNNDGIQYLNAARLFLAGGYDAARAVFDWLALPILIAVTAQISGLPLETAAYLLSALFAAGTAAGIVAATREIFPTAGWHACAIVLTLPALINYRDYIIREFPAWCLLFAAFWLILKWARQPDWWRASGAQLLLLGSALFRPEYLLFSGVLIAWQVSRSARTGLRPLLMLLVLPLCGLLTLASLLATGRLAGSERLATQLNATDLGAHWQRIETAAQQLAAVALNHYSADEAVSILLFGLLSTLVIKFISNCGIFIVPLLYGLRRPDSTSAGDGRRLFLLAFVTHACVLAAFLLQNFFLTGRYVGLLALLAIPLMAAGSQRLCATLPALRHAGLLLAVLLSLSSFLPLATPKTQNPAAAAWLKAAGIAPGEIFIESPQMAYHAGWEHYARHRQSAYRKPDEIVAGHATGEFRYFAIRVTRATRDNPLWAATGPLQVAGSFFDRDDKRGILILERKARP